jgi:hypothetical protein
MEKLWDISEDTLGRGRDFPLLFCSFSLSLGSTTGLDIDVNFQSPITMLSFCLSGRFFFFYPGMGRCSTLLFFMKTE